MCRSTACPAHGIPTAEVQPPPSGFSMVEMIVAVVLLAVGVLALAAGTSRLTQVTVDVERQTLALQACEDRLARIRLHPRYAELDSLFSESRAPVPGAPGLYRSTSIQRIRQAGDREGRFVDFARVTVTVEGSGLRVPVSRTVAIGVFAP